MDLRQITWDYAEPLQDEAWRARRLAEFFPFVADEFTRADKNVILRYLDQIKLPDERKAITNLSFHHVPAEFLTVLSTVPS